MSGEDEIRHLLEISERGHFTTSEAIAGATIASVLGTQIPVGVTRTFWKLIVSPRSATQQQLQITEGDAVSGYENVIKFRQDIPSFATEFGGDPLDPLFSLDPVTVAATNDRVAAVHETDAIDIEYWCYDEPQPLNQ